MLAPAMLARAMLAIVILAAGQGTRMKSALPKVMHRLLGRPMIAHLMETLGQLQPDRQVVVIGPDMESVAQTVAPVPTVVQRDRLGTGHAVRQAEPALAGFTHGTVLVVYGDTPLVSPHTLLRLIAARESADAGVAVLGFRPNDPGAYGRLLTEADGSLKAIVEASDATPEQKAVTLCNSGVMALDAAAVWGWLAGIDNANAKGEYYLTDVVARACADGRTAVVVEGSVEELSGINARAELARAEHIAQEAKRAEAMAGGASLINPASVFFSHDTRLGRDVVVAPFTVFGPGVVVGDGVEIKGFCHLEQCVVADGAILGPYARLRPGTTIGEAAHIGNFVEIKNAEVEAGAKVNHLSYIGDAHIGAKANIGAGTITCNYDGFRKHKTRVGTGAFIGSNSALVAPVTVGDGAIVAAGSVVTEDVPDNALAIARGRQENRTGWATVFRNRFKTPK